VLTAFYASYIVIVTLAKPQWAPALPPEARSIREPDGASGLKSLLVLLVFTVVVSVVFAKWYPQAPFDETLDAYARLIRQGKVKAIGASNLTAARLAEALDVSAREGLPRYDTLQPPYNLYDRETFEGDLRDLCLREDIGVITYYSLAAGFLTGKYRTEADYGKSPRGTGMKKFLNERGLRILDALDDVAARLHSAPATVALAWLMAQPGVDAAIASATSLAQFEALIAATRLSLDEVDMRQLEEASA
jgi:aryl-alcohol dehydrogenase-like predicted oxidoreductase